MPHKILFSLTQDADGYPPVAAESVWAIHRGGQHYEIDTIPFFTSAATLGDIVEAADVDGELRYTCTVHPSTNSLIRVVWYEGSEPTTLRQALERQGCSTELFQQYQLIAVNVPATIRLDAVIVYLLDGHNQDLWDYEEAILRQ